MQRSVRRTAVIMTNVITATEVKKQGSKHAIESKAHSKEHKNISLNSFAPSAPFLYPLKISRKLTVF